MRVQATLQAIGDRRQATKCTSRTACRLSPIAYGLSSRLSPIACRLLCRLSPPACHLVVVLCLTSSLSAQGPGFQMGHMFTDPPATSYRLGSGTSVFGPLGFGMHAAVIDGRQPMGNLWGAGVDLSLFRSGRPGVYLLGGVEGGVVTSGSHNLWSSWSAGLGYEVIPFSGLSLAAEGRYRKIEAGGYGGMEISFRLGLDRGSRGGSSRDLPGTGSTESRIHGPPRAGGDPH